MSKSKELGKIIKKLHEGVDQELVKKEFEETLLLTGLCNAQSLRTAEMLDLKCLIYVRGKELDKPTMELAKDMNISIFTTNCTMYEACGRLYQEGLDSVDVI